MSLGFDQEELDRIYWQEFEVAQSHNELTEARDISNLRSQGYSPLEAALQVKVLSQMSASAAATIAVVSLNNQRIAAQLSQKGLEV